MLRCDAAVEMHRLGDRTRLREVFATKESCRAACCTTLVHHPHTHSHQISRAIRNDPLDRGKVSALVFHVFTAEHERISASQFNYVCSSDQLLRRLNINL